MDVRSVKIGAAMLAFGVLLAAGGLLVLITVEDGGGGYFFIDSGQNGLLFFGLGVLTVLVGLANLHGGLTADVPVGGDGEEG